jgi:hypothetical protein
MTIDLLGLRDGHWLAAVAGCLVSRSATASVLSRSPLRLGSSGSVGSPRCSVIQRPISRAVGR